MHDRGPDNGGGAGRYDAHEAATAPVDSAGAATAACVLCGGSDSYVIHRSGSTYACCDGCGWVQEVDPSTIVLATPPTSAAVAAAAAATAAAAAGTQLAASVDQAREQLAAQVTKARARLAETASSAVVRGRSLARRAPPAYLAAKVAALARLQTARKWSQGKLQSVKAAAAAKYPAYFAYGGSSSGGSGGGGDGGGSGNAAADTPAPQTAAERRARSLRQFQALLVAGFDAITVAPRSHEQSVQLLHPGDALYYECMVLDHDVRLEVLRRDMRVGGAVETAAAESVTVVSGSFCSKHLRMPPWPQQQQGKGVDGGDVGGCGGGGGGGAVEVIVRFNNGASWFRAKQVAFRVLVSRGGAWATGPAAGTASGGSDTEGVAYRGARAGGGPGGAPVPAPLQSNEGGGVGNLPPPPPAAAAHDCDDGLAVPVISIDAFLRTP